MKIDYDQGRDDNGETFGFIYLEEGKGGWFFTYKKTLRATLKTLDIVLLKVMAESMKKMPEIFCKKNCQNLSYFKITMPITRL